MFAILPASPSTFTQLGLLLAAQGAFDGGEWDNFDQVMAVYDPQPGLVRDLRYRLAAHRLLFCRCTVSSAAGGVTCFGFCFRRRLQRRHPSFVLAAVSQTARASQAGWTQCTAAALSSGGSGTMVRTLLRPVQSFPYARRVKDAVQ